MKSILLVISAILLLSAGRFFSSDSRSATVEKKDGLYIFWDCKPADTYEVIGAIHIKSIVMTGKYDEMLKLFIKRTKQTYPTADGILFNGSVHDTDEVSVIKFK